MKMNLCMALLAILCACTEQARDAQAEDGSVKSGGSGTHTNHTSADSIQVAALLQECESLYNVDKLDEALALANQALLISQNGGYEEGVASAKYKIGDILLVTGKLTESLKAIEEALPYYVETNNQARMADLYNLKGNVYTDQGNKPEALNEYLTALKFYEAIGDKEGIAICHGNMGNINADMGRNDEAIREYETVLRMSLEMGYSHLASLTYNNLGTIYVTLNNLPEALRQHELSLQLKQETGDKRGQGIAYGNIGSIYITMGDYHEALPLFDKALKYAEESGDNDNAATNLANIGWAKIKLGQAREAKEWITKGLELAKELGSKETILQCYKRLCEADSAMGNYKGAFEYNKIFNAYQDSLVNEENIKRTLESKFEYDYEKKEAVSKAEQEKKDAIAEKELQKQKLVRNILVGGIGVVFIFALIFFRQRNKISIARKRSDELLLNILPEEVAEELKSKGEAEAVFMDQVSVLFTDFKGFTGLAETLSPQRLVLDLNQCFSEFDKITTKYGIEKIKTIGDAYMAAGGLPTPNSTHAADVVKAALEMVRFIEDTRSKRLADGAPYFEIRVGVHTGPVVAGIVGVKKFQYDIWGDTVNIASRMESSGEPGKVNISGSTYAELKDDASFSFESRGKIAAKGKGEIEMYFVEGRI